MRRLLQWLRNPPRHSMAFVLTVGAVFGIGFWGLLNTGMEWTNRTEFCTSCHEMTYLAEELRTTVHYKNRSGTTVSCADCHVASSKHPLDYARKATMKVLAARDVMGHLRGTIDTPPPAATVWITASVLPASIRRCPSWARRSASDQRISCSSSTTRRVALAISRII